MNRSGKLRGKATKNVSPVKKSPIAAKKTVKKRLNEEVQNLSQAKMASPKQKKKKICSSPEIVVNNITGRRNFVRGPEKGIGGSKAGKRGVQKLAPGTSHAREGRADDECDGLEAGNENEEDLDYECDGLRMSMHALNDDEFGEDFSDDEGPSQSVENYPSDEFNNSMNSVVDQDESGSQETGDPDVSEYSSEVILNVRPNPGTNDNENEEVRALKLMNENPCLGSIFKRMIRDGIEEVEEKYKKQYEDVAPKGKSGKDAETNYHSPVNANMNRAKSVKSPSDTTLYATTLKQSRQWDTGIMIRYLTLLKV